MKIDDPELRRRINANLQYVYSGQARRDKEALSAQRKQERKEQKRREKRLISLPKKIAKIREELEQLDQFFEDIEADRADIGLPTKDGKTDPAYKQGALEEVDSAREGCLAELIDLEDELRRLRGD